MIHTIKIARIASIVGVFATSCLALAAPAAIGKIGEADSAAAKFDYPEAIELYRAVPSPSRAVRVKIANACFWLAIERAKIDGEQEHWLKEAIAALDGAIALKPASDPNADAATLAEAHAQLGRAYGQLALHRGGKGKIELGRKIKEQADRALQLDSANAQAHAVLGKWNHELASLSGIERGLGGALFGEIPKGSFETALQELRLAVKHAPDVPYYRLLLAQTLIELKRKPEAKAELEALLKLKPRESADTGYARDARKLLGDL